MKRLRTTFIIFAILLIIAGCGSDDEGSSSEGAAASTDRVLPTATPVVLTTPTPQEAPPTPTPKPAVEGDSNTTLTESGAPAATDIMIQIPAGAFIMGHNQGDFEDAPRRDVDLPAYEIDKFEVTNADFAAFADATGHVTFNEEQGYFNWRDAWAGEDKDGHPVIMVTWHDASAYCAWVNKRLPTEAEWEKAARGDDAREFPWGNDWDPDKANVKERGLRSTAFVGSFGAGASPYGVEDMAGNVGEWTADWYQPYPGNTADDPAYGEKFRVTRGGSWFDLPAQVTTYTRNAADPNKTAIDELGFRCTR